MGIVILRKNSLNSKIKFNGLKLWVSVNEKFALSSDADISNYLLSREELIIETEKGSAKFCEINRLFVSRM